MSGNDRVVLPGRRDDRMRLEHERIGQVLGGNGIARGRTPSKVDIFMIFFLIKKYKNYRRELVFGTLFFFVNIFLVMHIIPIRGRLVAADRYTYLAYLGLFYIFGQLLINILEKGISTPVRRIIYFLFISYVAAISIYTFERNKIWKNSIVLFNDVIERDPGIPLAYNNRGWSKFNLNDPEGALSDYNKAILLDSSFAGVYNNRGWLKYNMGDLNGALKDYNTAVRIFPDFSLVYNNRGKARLDMNDIKAALGDFNNAIRINPLNSIAFCNRAKIKIDKKDYQGAIIDLDRSLEFSP